MCKFCKKVINKKWITLITLVTVIYCITASVKDADYATGLVSAFALAFVVAGLFIQRKELKLQRKELRNTRKELKGQKKETAKQNQILRIQQFENGFFLLKKELNDEYLFIKNKSQDRDIFELQHSEAIHNITFYEIEKSYYSTNSHILFRPFYRKLYILLKYTDESLLLPSKSYRYEYIKLVRESFSEYQLITLFYHIYAGIAANDEGVRYYESFKYLIEKYAFFKNLYKSKIITSFYENSPELGPKLIKADFYKSSAYDDTELLKEIEKEKISQQ